METLTIAGVSAVVIIALVVELAKRCGLPTKWAALVAVALGIVCAVLVQVSGASATFATWLDVIVTGLMTGLASAGLYSGQKAVRGR